MKAMLRFTPALFLLIMLWSATATAQTSPDSFFSAEFFPMEKGTYWIYQGTVKWQEATSPATRKKNVVWKMEVVDSLHKGEISAALIKGHPADLAWYDPDKKPGDYLIVRNRDRFYFLRDAAAVSAYHDLANAGRLPGEQHIFFVLPLKPGKHFCDPGEQKNPNGFYCWVVEKLWPAGWMGIQGISPSTGIKYQLSYRTVPDYELAYLVPRVGITRWLYSHHGTMSDVDVALIRLHRGAETK